MKVREWNRLKETNNFEKLKVGDFFIMGENMLNQKETKSVGQEITYYKLLKKGKSIEYTPVYDVLEEEG